MSDRAYRAYTRSNLDRDRFPGYQSRRAWQTLLLRLSLGVNLLAVILWAWSATSRAAASSNSQWNELLVQSATDISLFNRDLRGTAAVLQHAKEKLAVEAKPPAKCQKTEAAPADQLAEPDSSKHADTPPATAATVANAGQAVKADAAETLWLTIGIPTIPRHNHTDYLTPTLEYLMAELPSDESDPIFGKVQVLVMNNLPGQHPVFDRVQERVRQGASEHDDVFAQKALTYIEFIDNPGTIKDPTPSDRPEPDDFNNPKDIPGREVRRQTCDLIELMEMAQPLATYYMFMEDDFRVCPHTLRLLQYILAKLNALPSVLPWLGLRISYGMNGIVLRSIDLASLANLMRARIEVKPPDLLWVEWFSGKGLRTTASNRRRPMAAYKYNLLEHMGKVSSFSVRVDRPDFPTCYAPMADAWSLSKAERFQARKCPNSDLSPCPHASLLDDWLRIPLASLEALSD